MQHVKKLSQKGEQIDELKKSTLASYVNKAAHQVRAKSGIAASFETQGERKRDPERKASYMGLAKDFRQGTKKRLTGIKKATAKLAREEVEAVDEAQKKLKPSYWRAEWRLGTQTEVDKNNLKIYKRLAATDPKKAKAFHDNLMKMRKEEVEQCAPGQYYCNTDKMCKPIPEGYKVQKDGMLVKVETQREGFLDFFKKKKSVAKKPALNHAHARSVFKKLDKETRIAPMSPSAQKVRTVYAEANDDFVKRGVEAEKKMERERRIRDMRVIHHQNRHVKQASMGAHLGEGSADSSLAAKAKKSGVSLGTLRKVYNRGVAAWNSGHRPGTTPQQWGHARVNSYITKGKTYHTADKDLRRESVDINEAFDEVFGNEIE